MRKLMLLAPLSLALTLAACGNVAPPTEGIAAKALQYEAQPKPLASSGNLSAQTLTKTIGLSALSSMNPECALIYVTITASTPQDPLAAYYGVTAKSTLSGTTYYSTIKSVLFTIDSAHDWNVHIVCADPRSGYSSNTSASSFQIWRAAWGDAGFANSPTRYLVSSPREVPYWSGYGITKEIQTYQGSYYPDASYAERNRPHAGSN